MPVFIFAVFVVLVVVHIVDVIAVVDPRNKTLKFGQNWVSIS